MTNPRMTPPTRDNCTCVDCCQPDPRMTPTNDAPVTVEELIDKLRARVISDGWREVEPGKSCPKVKPDPLCQQAADRLAALASAPAGDGVTDGEPAPWAIAAERAATDAYAQHMGLPEESDPTAGQRAAALAIERHATAALARPRVAVGERDRESDPLHEYLGDHVAEGLGIQGGGADYWRVRRAIVEAIEGLGFNGVHQS